SYIDRQVISLLVEPIKASLRLSDTQLGLMQGVSFSLFYVAATLPLAWLADRGNRPALMAGCVAGWSVMTMLCGAAGNFWQLLLARVGVAVGEAGLPGAALTVMADRFEPKRLARATSVFMLAPFMGGGLALLGGGALYAATAGWDMPSLPGIGTVERWQLVFILTGAPGLLAAAALLLIADPRRGNAAVRAQAGPNLASFLRQEWRFVSLYILSVALTSMLLSTYISWLPAAMMRAHGLNEQSVGLLFGPIYFLAGAAGTLVAGMVVSRGSGNDPVGFTLRFMRISVTILLPVAIAGPQMPMLALELPLMGLAIFLISSVIGLSSLPLQYVVPRHLRAQAIAFMGMVSAMIGTGIGPLAAGVLSDRLGFTAQPLSMALSLIAALSLPLVFVMLRAAGRRHARMLASLPLAISKVPA
ncbi:MFS transporter, partial [Niveispirillum sp.]|uniref:MFS transporter n=1 Tax=Niveispirillum sp. TaxID=1917217 RepID=UPI001B4D5AB3